MLRFEIDVVGAHSVPRLVELSRCAAMVFDARWCSLPGGFTPEAYYHGGA
jgi:hypothetical protein